MDTSREEADDLNPKKSKAKGLKAKSCKGYLYYSAALKSQARNPRCYGISRTLPQVSEEFPRIKHEANSELPVGYGVKVLVGKQVSSNKPAPAQAQAQNEGSLKTQI